MSKSLIIVESPAKARTISKYLGRGYAVMASVGHVKDLPENKLGVDIAHNFTPHYVTIKGKAQVLAEIKKKAKEADKVYLAPDPDREGEAIAWHIAQEIDGKSVDGKAKGQARKVLRVLFNEITESAIKRALQSPGQIDMNLVNAQQARRVLDRIVGYQGSQLLWKKRNPVAPFITSRLQQEAARKLRFSPKKTMTLAQQLYEGVDIGKEGPTGLITYMRTDSTRIAREAAEEARQLIRERFGSEYLPATLNVFKTQKAAQDAHEAIRPTSIHRDPESIRPFLDRDHYQLYKLIWTRFIASQMAPALLEVTRVDCVPERTADAYVFRATGTVVKFAGHLAVYQEGKDAELAAQSRKTERATEEEDEAERQLPVLTEGERLRLVAQEGQAEPGLTPKQHFTQPPPRYNEALLIKELEEKGIGRPSTYASITSTIQERRYVEKVDGRFAPTETGITVNDFLVKGFPDILDVDFTSLMEKEQQEVATDEKCEKCGSPMVIKSGRFGKFLACSAYPTCKNTKPLPLGVKCPKDGGDLTQKRSKKGRTFYACTNYPKCDFALWDRPVAKPCPQCRAPFLVEKYSKQTGTSLVCRNDECGYKE